MLKYIIVLLNFCSLILSETIFQMQLQNGGYANKFEKFQESGSCYAKDDTDTTTSDPVVTFTALSKYSGIITKNWILSTTGAYYITIYFKGDAGKRTGGYLGYMRSDALNIYRTIGLDYEDFMDIYQFYSFNTRQGEWNIYKAYIQLPTTVSIKLVLEQGTYFGISEKSYAAFKDLIVKSDKWLDECPGTDAELKQSYFTNVFSNMNLINKVKTTMSVKDKSTGTLTFSYLNLKAPCVVPAFYILDSKKAVIDTFALSSDSGIDYTSYLDVMTWKYTFTLSQLETAGCISQQIECVKDGIAESCINYTCQYAFHFYYDLGAQTQFSTKQEQYDYSSQKSQVMFNSYFSVIVFKENSTVLNTLVYTKTVNNTICTQTCTINMDLSLSLSIKNSVEEAWVTPSGALNKTWGDRLYIKIASNPTQYKLELIDIYLTTDDEQSFSLGTQYIDSFIENKDSTVNGQLTFSMLVSGEAGSIQKGKKYNLKFLSKTTAVSSRILDDATDLPLAQITNSVGFTVNSKEDFAYKLQFVQLGIFFGLLLLLI